MWVYSDVVQIIILLGRRWPQRGQKVELLYWNIYWTIIIFFLFKDHLVGTAIIYLESSSGGFLFRFTQFMIPRRRVGPQGVLVKLLPINNLKICLQKKTLTLMKVTSDNVESNFSKFKCGFICFLFVCYNIIYIISFICYQTAMLLILHCGL